MSEDKFFSKEFIDGATAYMHVRNNEAAKHFLEGHKRGDVFCTIGMARCVHKGHGYTKNAFLCKNLCDEAERNGIEAKLKEGRNVHKNMFCSYYLGMMYQYGFCGKTADIGVIISLFEEAFARGHRRALISLGYMYCTGCHGAEKDLQRGIALYEKATELGCVQAMHNLGYLYDGSHSEVPQDWDKAKALYMRASELGFGNSTYNLGIIHFIGGSRHNDLLAFEYFEKAALQQNHPGSHLYLSEFYRTGRGNVVPQDAMVCLHLINKAYELGVEVKVAERYACLIDWGIVCARNVLRAGYILAQTQQIVYHVDMSNHTLFLRMPSHLQPVLLLKARSDWDEKVYDDFGIKLGDCTWNIKEN